MDKPHSTRLRRFFVREDALYEQYASSYQAKSTEAKVIYLLLYLLPGIFAFAFLNIEPVFRTFLRLTGLSAKNLQFAAFLVVTYGWHILLPFVILKTADRLALRQSLEFLGLNRVDWRGLLLVLPVYYAAFALVSAPYITFIGNPLTRWLATIPAFRIPNYSMFATFYSFPPLALALIFVGNFLGEELYFRGYLMKKTAFLGNSNWVVNSVLFSLYHLWQIPQTWPLTGLVLAFGLLMALRKDLYVLVVFHAFVNLWLAFGEYRFAHLLGLR